MSAAIEFEKIHDPDADLIRRCQAGGPDADLCFKILMDRHASSIERRATRILGNPADAEDIVQEVFVSVHRFLDRYRPDRPFQHWLSIVTLNACRIELRRRSSRVRRHEAFKNERKIKASHDVAADPLVRRTLLDVFGELHDETRDCILLRVVNGLSYKEIAARQDSSIPAVKMRVSRGLRELRGRLELVGVGVEANAPSGRGAPSANSIDRVHAA